MSNQLIPITQEQVKSFIESQNPFPVDFEQAWKWAGYTTKHKAKSKLTSAFDETLDFTILQPYGGKIGRPSDDIFLTADCFKEFSMMANTEQGKKVRRYFLDCEKELKSIKQNQVQAPTTLYDALMLAAETEKQKQLLLIENKAISNELKVTKTENLIQHTIIENQAPAQMFYSNFTDNTLISTTDLARYLVSEGIGAYSINSMLKKAGVLTKSGNKYFTTAKYNNGYFKIIPGKKTNTLDNGYEYIIEYNTVLVLQKGYDLILSLLPKNKNITPARLQQLSLYDVPKGDSKNEM